MIRLTPDAIADVRRLRAFLDHKNPHAARRFLRVMLEALGHLTTFPAMGTPTGRRDIRQITIKFGGSGYIVRYIAMPNGNILITRIWHGREART